MFFGIVEHIVARWNEASHKRLSLDVATDLGHCAPVEILRSSGGFVVAGTPPWRYGSSSLVNTDFTD
jgi:hypothetical protein